MAELTTEVIIRNEKASEIEFRAQANAEDRQADFYITDQQIADFHRGKAQEFRECAQIAHNKWKELESGE